MFVDEKILTFKAGKGGDGASLFRREIYVPHGGPDGGDGGNGGNIILTAEGNLHALSHLAHIDKIEAEDGVGGGHKKSTGKTGEDVITKVPLGTEIYERIDDEWVKLIELVEQGQSFKLCKGGSGGWGNWHFRSSIQQAPERFNFGLEGEKKIVKLVLKLIADVGLVGLPNAGKSTFLSTISAAKPKIADYPFTTLEPQLGVAQLNDKEGSHSIVIADLPGLIEGASEGKGLGVNFLKHVERTKTILHLIDASVSEEEILHNYQVIRNELESWSKELSIKPEIIVLTKNDLLLDEELEQKLIFIQKELGVEVFSISAVAHKGLKELMQALTFLTN